MIEENTINKNDVNQRRIRWQNSRFLEPGTRVIHPALQKDFPKGHGDTIIFGKQPQQGSKDYEMHIEDIWQEDSVNNCERIKIDCKKSYFHDINKPKLLQDDRNNVQMVNHGRNSNKNKNKNRKKKSKAPPPMTNVHKLLQPEEQITKNEEKLIHEQYLKSHGSYQPGEQKSRDYNWNINPVTTTFGIQNNTVERGNSSKGVSEALIQQELEQNQFNHKKKKKLLCSIIQEEQQKYRMEEKIVHGIKTNTNDDTTAKDCLSIYNDGDSTDDLGRSLRPGFRNVYTQVSELNQTYHKSHVCAQIHFIKRAFGCPSIRTDIPKYFPNSIANTQNFGDDVNASYLLRPTPQNNNII